MWNTFWFFDIKKCVLSESFPFEMYNFDFFFQLYVFRPNWTCSLQYTNWKGQTAIDFSRSPLLKTLQRIREKISMAYRVEFSKQIQITDRWSTAIWIPFYYVDLTKKLVISYRMNYVHTCTVMDKSCFTSLLVILITNL